MPSYIGIQLIRTYPPDDHFTLTQLQVATTSLEFIIVSWMVKVCLRALSTYSKSWHTTNSTWDPEIMVNSSSIDDFRPRNSITQRLLRPTTPPPPGVNSSFDYKDILDTYS